MWWQRQEKKLSLQECFEEEERSQKLGTKLKNSSGTGGRDGESCFIDKGMYVISNRKQQNHQSSIWMTIILFLSFQQLPSFLLYLSPICYHYQQKQSLVNWLELIIYSSETKTTDLCQADLIIRVLVLIIIVHISPETMKSQTNPRSNKTNSLTHQFVCSILGQQDNYRKHKNKANLTHLIELYRKLVEFYSERNDNISFYFMEKIGQLSSEIPLLQEADEKLTMSMAREVMEQDSGQVDSRFKNLVSTPNVKYDPQQKKKERSKNAQIAIEVSKVKKRTNARTILKSYYEECMQNNNLINADLQMQRKQLQQKLMAIHKKSMEMGNKKLII